MSASTAGPSRSAVAAVAAELARVQAQVADERTARMVLARLVEPGDRDTLPQVDDVGALATLHGLDPASELARRVAPRLADIDVGADARMLHALGARVLVPGDDEWPPGLVGLPLPPLALWVRGAVDLAEACARSVAMVGARAATAYGVHMARELAAGVAERGFAVVSGAAFGIDAAAHEGALVVDGVTVAVLAGGIDRPYPVAHTGLLERIAGAGAVVSQVPPGWSPTRWRFLSRNRLIATMTQGTVVVEAGLRSGSRNTARHAREAGRQLAAVPGPVTSAVSAGCHEEIRDEATLVTDAAEVVELLGRIGELAPAKRAPKRPEDDLDPAHARVLECLQSTRTLDVDALAERVGLGTGAVRTALGVLQLEGLCHPVRGGWRRVGRREERW